MNANRIKIILAVLGVFATVNTILILYFQSLLYSGSACSTPPCVLRPVALAIYARISIPLSVGSWLLFGVALTLWRQSSGNVMRFSMMRAGFDKSVYDLMVKMRGS